MERCNLDISYQPVSSAIECVVSGHTQCPKGSSANSFPDNRNLLLIYVDVSARQHAIHICSNHLSCNNSPLMNTLNFFTSGNFSTFPIQGML